MGFPAQGGSRRRSLYELNQTLRWWNERFTVTLLKLRFHWFNRNYYLNVCNTDSYDSTAQSGTWGPENNSRLQLLKSCRSLAWPIVIPPEIRWRKDFIKIKKDVVLPSRTGSFWAAQCIRCSAFVRICAIPIATLSDSSNPNGFAVTEV